MTVVSLRHVFDADPLNDGERRRGMAIRVPECIRRNDYDIDNKPTGFIWSVIIARQDEAPESPVLSWLSRAYCRVVGWHAVPNHLSSETVEFEGEAWHIDEFAFDLPRALLSFGVHAGNSRMRLSRRERNDRVHAHFKTIRNAYAAEEAYPKWLESHRSWLAQNIADPQESIKISIISPVYKTPPEFLREMINSVRAQTYQNWELVIINASPEDDGVRIVLNEYSDTRINVIEMTTNEGIVGNTNVGIREATGEYVAFLDHDDFLEPKALAAIVNAVKMDPDIDLLYCDEDSYQNGTYCIPLLKPDWDLDLLYSNNYVIHFLVVSERALKQVELSSSEVEGAQDYDLTLKVAELKSHVCHLPYVLYHWRMHAGSTNANAGSKPYAQEAGRVAIQSHLKRRGVPSEVRREKEDFTYRSDFTDVPRNANFLLAVTDGSGYEKKWDGLDEYCEEYGGSVRRFMLSKGELTTDLMGVLKGGEYDYLVVSDPLIKYTKSDIATMMGYFSREEIFAVSPRVLRADGLVESSGCIVAPDGEIVKLGRGLPAADPGYIGRLVKPCNRIAVSDDFLIVRVSLLERYLNTLEDYSSILYMMNDSTVRAYKDGLLSVYTPFACMQLFEPRSLIVDGKLDLENDRKIFVKRHSSVFDTGDPTHNKSFDPYSPYFTLRKSRAL